MTHGLETMAQPGLAQPLGVLLLGADGRVEDVDDALVHSYGMRRDQIVGRDWEGLGLPASLAEAWRRTVARVVESGAVAHFRRPSRRFGEVVVQLLPGPEGRVWTMNWTPKTLVGVERSSQQLMAVAHELRNLLTTMVLQVEALSSRRTGALPVQRLRRLARRGAALFDGLEEGVDASAPVDEVVADAVDAMLTTCPRLTVRGGSSDQVASLPLQVALSTLIDNAVDATDGGLVEVEIETLPGRVAVRVRDHGPGVADHVQLFQRGSSTKGTGRGMGLAMARDLVVDAGGTLVHTGGPTTTFTVTLPVIPRGPRGAAAR